MRDHYFITDMESRHEVLINGEPVPTSKMRHLGPKDAASVLRHGAAAMGRPALRGDSPGCTRAKGKVWQWDNSIAEVKAPAGLRTLT